MSQCCEFIHDVCRPDAPLTAVVLEGQAVPVTTHRDPAPSSEVLVEGLLVWSVGVLASVAAILVAVSNAPGLLP